MKILNIVLSEINENELFVQSSLPEGSVLSDNYKDAVLTLKRGNRSFFCKKENYKGVKTNVLHEVLFD